MYVAYEFPDNEKIICGHRDLFRCEPVMLAQQPNQRQRELFLYRPVKYQVQISNKSESELSDAVLFTAA